jgi:hypothetical protein
MGLPHAQSPRLLQLYTSKGNFQDLKVEKQKFDTILLKLLKAKPKPRNKIKTNGKRGSKQPLLKK